MVTLPIYWVIALGLGLLALLIGVLYGVAALFRQMAQGPLDFAGTMPTYELVPDERTDHPYLHTERPEAPDKRLKADLLETAQEELGPPGEWRRPG